LPQTLPGASGIAIASIPATVLKLFAATGGEDLNRVPRSEIAGS
jgi:hypothetical protein